MNIKDQIIISSTKLFDSFGVKGTSMNDLAHEVGISKRTLYEYFNSKDHLVQLYIEYKIDSSGIFTNTQGTLIDDLLHCYFILENSSKHSFCEVRKYYKDVFTYVRQRIIAFAQICKNKLSESKKMDYVRDDISTEFIEEFVADYLFGLIFCKKCFQNNNSWQMTYSLLIFIRGISTINGQNYIDNKLRDENSKVFFTK